MEENELNVRLQHAVIGEGTSSSAVPKKGEVVFNNTLDNCRVGDGVHAYYELPNLLSSSNNVRYYSYTTANTLEYILNGILSSGFDIDTYNHIVIDAVTLNSNPSSYEISGMRFYPLSTQSPTSDNRSVYRYLRNHPFKTLKISVFSSSSDNEDRAIGLFYFDTASAWQLENLRWCPSYSLYVGFINNTGVGGDNTYYSIVAKHPSVFRVGNEDKFGTTICITCVDPTNKIFLIE